MISDYLAFFVELPSSFKDIGSVIPSSRFLVNELVKAMPEKKEPIRILEAGAGTGVLTKKVIDLIQKDDEFHVYEINEKFSKHLEKLLGDLNGKASNVKLFNSDIRELKVEENEKYDVIFCGLPFMNFPPELVDEILEMLIKSLKEGGTLAYFGYLALPKIRQLYVNDKEKKRIKDVLAVLDKYKAKAKNSRRQRVYLNIPPAHGTFLEL